VRLAILAAPLLVVLPDCVWMHLAPFPGRRGMAIVRLVATSASQGWKPAEIASALGTTTPWVLSRLAELRNELEAGPSA